TNQRLTFNWKIQFRISLSVWRLKRAKSAFQRQHRFGGAAYMGGFRVGQPHFCNFVAERCNRLIICHIS
ncbi:hypothetical protein, partial [Novosphingobium rosa]|uniref:hypothetical protein n=1 Tax=Novosphingobium rosa TaxID=76978 RepID=UPI001C3FBBAD